jgi:hypothetical protein
MEVFLRLITGDATGAEHFAFIFFTFFGMFWIKIASYSMEKKKRAMHGLGTVFSFKKWLDDNTIDFVMAFMTAYALFRFFPDAFSFLNSVQELPEFTDKMAYGLVLGLMFQYLFHKAMNKVSISQLTTTDPTKPGGPKT